MKVLSIRQPWAWLIVHGGKDIENRTWSTKFRGRFLVHASKTVDKQAMITFNQASEEIMTKYGLTEIPTLSKGAVIGSVELVDVVEKSESPWFNGPFGFVLKDPRPEDHREIKGRLGFFDET